MKQELSEKANADDMEAALALKGDLELVNTKVGRLEFETAIEELGEAIGLLGIKFQRKWFVSKVTSFEFSGLKAQVKSPSASEKPVLVTCILCRRPAGIAGHECLEAMSSPKWPLKSATGGASPSNDKDKFMKTISDAIAKRQKLEGPPFDIDRDTIISSPEEIHKPDLKIAPVDGLSRLKKESKSTEEKQQTFRFEVQPPVTPKPSRESGITFSTDVIIDPAGNLKSFAPMRLMQDPLRREIIISPPLPKGQQTSAMSLAPLSSEASSIRESTSSQ
ncbi:uncharacterized protein TNIN_368311 [Trichonephila inaurata madagascariensis]|uniref:Uncharacterized protein n=1 Tax=Trichonephila inaurata madagascariensis TaxID=2747483 RepID=A0A8X6XZA6_9ARAC|nr:uncharacterized protein TNIN_368311 [Trichonephila inaurata madagascariensis]